MTVVQDSAASRLFRRGEVCITRGDTSEALRFLQEAIQCDPRFSAAHHRIAQIYLGLGTLEDRILAREALEHALRYEPENLNVLLTQLHLELFIEYDGMARRLIRKILRIDSTNAEAHFAQGLLREKEWLKYRSMISVNGEPYDPVIIPFTEFVQKDLNIAKVSFRHAVRHNPTYIEAYTHLALLCFETEEPERMVTLLKEGLRHNPEHKDLLLFLGLAYHSQRQFDKALNTYMQARTQMTPEELALFESADLISTPTEAVRIQEVDETEKRKNVYAFWKQRDPLYLTEVNERLLEHYSRFAYANLRYRISAIPGVRQGIAGWGSDPGKVFIRYGSPLNEHSTWSAIKGTSADSKYATPPTPGRNPMSFSSMIWSYRDFSFTFQDYSLNRNYRFRWGVE